jgi:sensor histidine kinase YesM
MLMVFGNLGDLSGSFFSQEALFLIVLTYISHEWAIFLIGRKRSRTALGSAFPRILYFLILSISTMGINTGIILIYFIYVLGYPHYTTELVTMNSLLLLFQVLVHVYYLSMLNIRRYHTLSMEREEIQSRQLQTELESFKSEMNPDLLMECLESLLMLIRKDSSESEQYIQSLSNQYRYMLDSRKKEFIRLDRELKAAGEFIYLLNGGSSKRISLEVSIPSSDASIIPGTLHTILYSIENSMILNPLVPLVLDLEVRGDGSIRIRHDYRPKLAGESGTRMEKLNQSYVHYTGKEINRSLDASSMEWIVPGLPEIIH